jgi:hypothetical protein
MATLGRRCSQLNPPHTKQLPLMNLKEEEAMGREAWPGS